MSGNGLWFRATRAIPRWGVVPGNILAYSAGRGGMGLRVQGTDRILTRNLVTVCETMVWDQALERLEERPARAHLTLTRSAK